MLSVCVCVCARARARVCVCVCGQLSQVPLPCASLLAELQLAWDAVAVALPCHRGDTFFKDNKPTPSPCWPWSKMHIQVGPMFQREVLTVNHPISTRCTSPEPSLISTLNKGLIVLHEFKMKSAGYSLL
jgi:hypothetical protein